MNLSEKRQKKLEKIWGTLSDGQKKEFKKLVEKSEENLSYIG